MKQFLFLLVFFTILSSRENPFLPSDINSKDLVPTNLHDTIAPFTRQIFKFPSEARELVKAVFYYKSIDGSIREKVVDINAKFDWHREFILKTEMPLETTTSRVLDVSATKISAKDQNKTSSNLIAKIEPPIKSFDIYDLIKFDIYSKKVVILTKDPKIRDFLISKPDKIVIDFQRKDLNLNTTSVKIDKGIVKKIVFGSHIGYYRVVISLDGNYRYSLVQSSDKYILEFR